MLPETDNFFHFPRAQGRGGGVAAVVTKSISQVKSFRRCFSSFECLQVKFTHHRKKFHFFIIYRPPNPKTSFLIEFEDFLLESQQESGETFYVGDFNFWFDDVSDPDTIKLRKILTDFHLSNHINFATYDSGHILDLVIAEQASTTINDIVVEPVCTISDHRLISFYLNLPTLSKHEKLIKFRRVQDSISERFCEAMHVPSSEIEAVCSCGDSVCVNCLSAKYRQRAEEVFQCHAPCVEKIIKVTDKSNRWYNSNVKNAKRKLIKAEKLYKRFKN